MTKNKNKNKMVKSQIHQQPKVFYNTLFAHIWRSNIVQDQIVTTIKQSGGGLSISWEIEGHSAKLNGRVYIPNTKKTNKSTFNGSVSKLINSNDPRVTNLIKEVQLKFDQIKECSIRSLELFSKNVDDFCNKYNIEVNIDEFCSNYTCQHTDLDFWRDNIDSSFPHIEIDIVNWLSKNHKSIGKDIKSKNLLLSNYPDLFTIARAIRRSHSSFLGPTNSGKTYQALKTLTAASSGVYLAPLRLMAVEVYDKFVAEGIPCNLITGEEIILNPDARHSSSTIEMMNYSNEVDVAVIDEVQMMNDKDRGWAWVQAIIGVPAKKVIHVGSNHVSSQISKITKLLNEPYYEQLLERKTKLSVEQTPVGLCDVEKGDAIVAFSRIKVLGYRDWLMQKGHTVACIYGALSPEVKRKQSELFSSGKADILVATDAIGMGLNLPIRRIIFSELEKFDGNSFRFLEPIEIKQIGGRAGRFGLHEDGLVCSLDGQHDGIIEEDLESEIEAIDGHFSIQPPWTIVKFTSEKLKTDKIDEVFAELKNSWLKKDNTFKVDFLDNKQWLTILSKSGLSLQEQYYYSNCPIDDKSDYVYDWVTNHQAGREILISNLNLTNVWDTNYNLEILSSLEYDIKKMTIYKWLNIKFPEYYTNIEEVKEKYTKANDTIMDILGKVGLSRLCDDCGSKLDPQHKFPTCENCFENRFGFCQLCDNPLGYLMRHSEICDSCYLEEYGVIPWCENE